MEFADRVFQQARRFGVELLQAQEVTHINDHDGYRCIEMENGTHYHAQAALVATGATYRRLEQGKPNNKLGWRPPILYDFPTQKSTGFLRSESVSV